MGFRRKSSNLYESVFHLKYQFYLFYRDLERKPFNFCTNANFGTQMYYSSLETFQLEVI